MNRVVGGSLPAEIWREIMLGAHAGKPPLSLTGAAPAIYVSQEPGYPQDRIADDFIARALGSEAGDTGSTDQLMQR